MEELIPKELLDRLPKLYDQEGTDNPDIYLEIKHPLIESWAWYVTEYDPIEQKFYGYVKDFDNEWKFFYMSDLTSVGCYWNPGFKKVKFNELFNANE